MQLPGILVSKPTVSDSCTTAQQLTPRTRAACLDELGNEDPMDEVELDKLSGADIGMGNIPVVGVGVDGKLDLNGSACRYDSMSPSELELYSKIEAEPVVDVGELQTASSGT